MSIDWLRKRFFPESNYKGIYKNWQTLRLQYNPKKPITELEFPEFYDVKITNKCFWNCSYCYQDSKVDENHYDDIVWKAQRFFWKMNENQKPFQVAIGWWNPNEHPEFVPLLKYLYDIEICPNYTTNWMWVTQEIIDATKTYCWGVALSCHKHLDKIWKESTRQFAKAWIRTNLHVIISDIKSIERFVEIYDEFKDIVEYFVLLPLTKEGRAKQLDVPLINFKYLMKVIKEKTNQNQVAFGAMFYPFLKENNELKLSLYEPEIMSKYLDMKDDWYMYPSSFAENILLKKWFLWN